MCERRSLDTTMMWWALLSSFFTSSLFIQHGFTVRVKDNTAGITYDIRCQFFLKYWNKKRFFIIIIIIIIIIRSTLGCVASEWTRANICGQETWTPSKEWLRLVLLIVKQGPAESALRLMFSNFELTQHDVFHLFHVLSIFSMFSNPALQNFTICKALHHLGNVDRDEQTEELFSLRTSMVVAGLCSSTRWLLHFVFCLFLCHFAFTDMIVQVIDMGGEAISSNEYLGVGKVTEFRSDLRDHVQGHY